MGYSMTVPFKSAEEKERMKTFLIANMDILNKLKDSKQYNPPHENTPYDGEDLSYTPNKKNLLGFHGSGIPSYIWSICAWMAVKSDVRDKNNNLYLYYDNEKEIVTFDVNNKKDVLVNSDGIKIERERDLSIPLKAIEMFLGTKKEQKKQFELLNELNNKWLTYIQDQSLVTSKITKPKI
jgi:hypothetical protein